LPTNANEVMRAQLDGESLINAHDPSFLES
jgi:hypothetical protein